MANPLSSVSLETQRVIACLAFNEPLDVPAIVDYGVDSEQHYQALKAAADYCPQVGDTEEKVDAVLRERWQEFERIRCNGKAITVFVEKYAPQFKGLTFRTSWDVINEGM